MIARLVATVAVLTSCVLYSVLARAADTSNIALENEFLRIVVNRGPSEAGRFSIKTTNGDQVNPATKNQHLIFGGNAPWTSYTSMRIDGDTWVFGGKTDRRAGLKGKYGAITTDPTLGEGKITTVCQLGDIEATQELTIVRGGYSRMLDTIGITYRLKNTGATAHDVGLRILLDTMCGSNDGAPVRAGDNPKYEKGITTATLLEGKDVPAIWQAFDDLQNPTVTSQGTLNGGETTRPDKLLFADWGTLADEPWLPEITEGQSFIRKGENELDSAAALFWNPVTLAPGQSLVYVTDYGMGNNKLGQGKLPLSLAAPEETTFQHEQTQPFTVIGYVKNGGGYEARDVVLKLSLPDGLELAEGQLSHSYKSFGAGDTVQANWVVRANGKDSGKKEIKLNVTSANIEENEVSQQIQLNVPKPVIRFVPSAPSVPLQVNKQSAIVPIAINLAPAEKFYGVRLVIKYDPAVLAPLHVSRGRSFVEDGKFLAGWDFDTSVVGQVTITGTRTGLAATTQAEANLATILFHTIAEGKSPLHFERAVLLNEKGAEGPVDVDDAQVEVVAKPTTVGGKNELLTKSPKELEKAFQVQTEDLARTLMGLLAAKDALDLEIATRKVLGDNLDKEIAARKDLETKVVALQKQLDDLAAVATDTNANLAKRLSAIDKLIADNDKKYADALAAQKAAYELALANMRAALDKEHADRLKAEADNTKLLAKIRSQAKKDRTIGYGIDAVLGGLIAAFAL